MKVAYEMSIGCMSNEFAGFINVISITPPELLLPKRAEERIIPNISTVFENLTKRQLTKNQSCKVDLAQRGLSRNTILDSI